MTRYLRISRVAVECIAVVIAAACLGFIYCASVLVQAGRAVLELAR